MGNFRNGYRVSLIDEISNICSVIEKMLETHKTTTSIPMIYINDLSENTEFERVRPKLFLIDKAGIRKEICDFYKELRGEIKKSVETVGTLKENVDQVTATNEIATKFSKLKSDASSLVEALKNYKFKPFGIV